MVGLYTSLVHLYVSLYAHIKEYHQGTYISLYIVPRWDGNGISVV